MLPSPVALSKLRRWLKELKDSKSNDRFMSVNSFGYLKQHFVDEFVPRTFWPVFLFVFFFHFSSEAVECFSTFLATDRSK